MLKYTICFIKRDNKILLLNRNKSPNMGMWNGVGGKIEKDETPYQSVIRETFEETGIRIDEPLYAGKVTWKSNKGDSGMYVFIADLPQDSSVVTPVITDEGILEWKDVEWIVNPENKGVVDNLKLYLPKINDGKYELEHKFTYSDGFMLDYKTHRL
ncbi:NUDIX hydrolase [Lysinibacillus capsici]|uniref:NUDIX hydrolase n=1 Tax=Lysinibacillus capsici TaxID=2115968 RepID=UPI001CD9BEFE|nr:8-oxo-dGTP diphosphatase [Lysinibacillus capsici]